MIGETHLFGRQKISDSLIYLVEAIVNGLIIGCLYATMALGMTIMYGVVRILNLAHGGMAVLGGYYCVFFLVYLGLGILPAIFGSLIISFFFGLLVFKFTIRSILKKPNWEFSSLIFLLGLGLLIENLILQVFGPRVKVIPKFFEGGIELGFLWIKWHETGLILFAIAFVVALNLFLKKTWLGQAMRAVAQDMDGARVVGININKVFGLTFAVATTVTGFSGILLGTKYFLTPQQGWEWMMKAFLIVVLGGLGSATGAIYAAFMLGITENIVSLYLNQMWVWPVWFLIFMGILIIRPQGLIGGRSI